MIEHAGKLGLGERLRKLRQAVVALLRHLSEAGGDHDGNVRPLLFDRVGEFKAGHLGHGVIGDDQIDRAALLEDVERLLAGRCRNSEMAEIVQHGDGIGQHQSVIVDREDCERGLIHRVAQSPLAQSRRRSLPLCHRQPKLGCCPFAQPALQRKPSAGLLGDTMHHGQAESRTLAGPLGGEERLHRAPQCRFIHSDAGVAHGQADVSARVQLCCLRPAAKPPRASR